MDCFVFFMPRRWHRRLGYHQLPNNAIEDGEESPSVTVVVGKERRVFVVDPVVLEKYPFRVLLGMMRKKESKEDGGNGDEDEDGIFVDVDAILFEHLLWLMHNDCSYLLHLNVEEIIDFYAQDY